MSKEFNNKQIRTPEFTLYFPDLKEPNKMSKKYRIVAVWDPGEKLTALKAAIKDAAVQKWGANIPKGLYIPIKTPEDETNPDTFPEGTLHAAFSTTRPYLVDRDPNRALTPDKFYPGCRCRAVVHAWPYDGVGSKPPGVMLALDCLQFVSDGERLGGGMSSARNLLADDPLSDAQDSDQTVPAEGSDEPFDFGF